MKRAFLITTLFLIGFTSVSFAVTAREWQAAYDVIRYTNIQNDLLDSVKPILKDEIKKEIPAESFGEKGTSVSYSVEEIKELGNRTAENVKLYKSKIDTYISDKERLDALKRGLLALGVEYDTLISDVEYFEVVADDLKLSIGTATTKEQLQTIAEDIDSKVPELELIRKTQ